MESKITKGVLMSAKNLDELIGQLTELYSQKFSAESKRNSLLDRHGRVMTGREKEENPLRDSIKARNAEIKNLLDEWSKEIPVKVAQKIPTTPPQRPIFEVNLDVNFNLIRDTFFVESFRRAGHINVPLGQVFVFGHEGMDDGGLPEVYLGGETILPKQKDKKSLIAALASIPGDVRCLTNQWLAGISVSKEDPARISIAIPVRLYDPQKTLSRTGGSWMTSDGRKNINADIKEELEHQFQEILSDRLQLWSSEKRDILGRIHAVIDKDLDSWGLRALTESISVVRQYPRNLYEIVLQFSRAEQYCLDAISSGETKSILEQINITSDDLTFIETTSKQRAGSGGDGLFLILRDKLSDLDKKPELRDKSVNWLRDHGGASAANYVTEITKIYTAISKNDYSPDRDPGLEDIRLSEQVILYAFRNPIIGLGEWLETAP